MPSRTHKKAIENEKKYPCSPTYDQVKKYVYDELSMTMLQFERFFGIPHGTMKQIAFGNRTLPVKYWHIVYEKIKPKFGVGYFNPETIDVQYTSTKKIKKQTPAVKEQPKQDNTALLEKLKEQLR